jgi:hypothetical protein
MSTGFDFAERRVVDAPNMAAEALTKPAPPNVEPGTELTYFMRITDGGTSNTWFKLDDFSFGASARNELGQRQRRFRRQAATGGVRTDAGQWCSAVGVYHGPAAGHAAR